MNLINELMDKNIALNNTQQGVLAIIYNETTPETSFIKTMGAQNLLNARRTLETLGMIDISNKSITLTDKGREAVKSYSIEDETGNISEYGKELIDATVENKKEWQTANEDYKILNTLL